MTPMYLSMMKPHSAHQHVHKAPKQHCTNDATPHERVLKHPQNIEVAHMREGPRFAVETDTEYTCMHHIKMRLLMDIIARRIFSVKQDITTILHQGAHATNNPLQYVFLDAQEINNEELESESRRL